MATSPDHPCRAALADVLALLDQHGQAGAACYVAMALDALDERAAEIDADAVSPLRVAAARRPD